MNDLAFFLRLFRPYHLWLIGGVFLSLLTALVSIALLGLSGWFICAAAIAGSFAPDGIAVTFNFLQPAAQIRALAIVRTLARYAERLLTHEATFRVLAHIRCWFFAKMIPLTPGRLALQRSGDLLTRMTNDIDALDALYLRVLTPLMVAMLATLGVTGLVAVYSLKLAALLALMAGFAGIILPLLFYHLGKSGARGESQQLAEYKFKQIEMLQGIKDLIVFQAYGRLKDALLNESERLFATQTGNNRLSALASALSQSLAQLTVLLILISGAFLLQQHFFSALQLALLLFCVWSLFEWLYPLPQAMQLLGKTENAARRIKSLTDAEPAIQEALYPLELPAGNHWQLENLSFRYQIGSDWVLRDVNLAIESGAKIAIIGTSGAGKSTFLHLLLRFFDPQQGRIVLNDIDVRKLGSEQLYQQVALLSQHSQIFSGTIRDNLRLGRMDAGYEEMREAIRLAGLSSLLATLPDGLDTLVGEQGSRLSGGEARRIALARVFLKDAPTLLLDEPTEGLDAQTEDDVLGALEQISRDKTLIMVTHRTTGLKLAERIIRLEDGELKDETNLMSYRE